MLEALIFKLINRTDLDRDAMISETERARRRALRTAETWGYGRPGEKDAKAAWEMVEELGRLLFFLTFRSRPMGASKGEVQLYKVLGEELRRREQSQHRPRGGKQSRRSHRHDGLPRSKIRGSVP